MHEELMEQVVTHENATAAWRAVKRNAGAPGIDGMTVQELRDHVRQHWETIRAKLNEESPEANLRTNRYLPICSKAAPLFSDLLALARHVHPVEGLAQGDDPHRHLREQPRRRREAREGHGPDSQPTRQGEAHQRGHDGGG